MAALAAGATVAVVVPAFSSGASKVSGTRNGNKPRKAVMMGRKMRAFAGMKAESQVSRLGCAESTERHFARAVLAAQCKASARGGGGAAASSCNIASEIFRVVPIMSGLVLTGIALGFVLLRVEAAFEESQ